jgi:hypothetical protein
MDETGVRSLTKVSGLCLNVRCKTQIKYVVIKFRERVSINPDKTKQFLYGTVRYDREMPLYLNIFA